MATFRDEIWPIKRLKPYEKNPRINEDAVETVVASIREFGFTNPVLVNESGTIIAGHTRFQAAIRLQIDQIPVRIAGGLSDDQERALRIMDNKSGEKSEWNNELLAIELSSLDLAGYDIELSGFDRDEFENLTLGLDEDCTVDEEPKPERLEYTISFSTEKEQNTWNRFLNWLADEYPRKETVAERLLADIQKRKVIGRKND